MSNILATYHTELDLLIDRFESFLKKLEVRAEELYQEAIVSAQEISDADEVAFYHFKLGINGQFNALTAKATEIYKQQIQEKSFDRLPHETISASENEANEYDKKIDQAYNRLQDFEAKIQDLSYKVFNNVIAQNSGKKIQDILDEYENIKSNFCCSQCGAELELEKIYFVSTYVTCKFCQTQNTFVPSSKMARLPDFVRDLAEQKTSDLENDYTKNEEKRTLFENFVAYEKWKRMHFFVKKELIPELATSYKDIYLREINDFLRYQIDTEDHNEKLYNSFFSTYGTAYIQQKLNELNVQNTVQSKEIQLKNLDELMIDAAINIELLNDVRFEQSNIQKEMVSKLEAILNQLNAKKIEVEKSEFQNTLFILNLN